MPFLIALITIPPKIAELAIIKGLFDSYGDNEFVNGNIIGMLEEITNTSNVEKHKRISSRLHF